MKGNFNMSTISILIQWGNIISAAIYLVYKRQAVNIFFNVNLILFFMNSFVSPKALIGRTRTCFQNFKLWFSL